LWKDLETTDAMANPNPNPSTRFGADGGNTPRAKQKGARDRLSSAFLTDFADDYGEHGKAVIATVREKDPVAYMRMMVTLQASKIEVTENPLDALTDEQVEAYGAEIDELNRRILERAKQGDPAAIERARTLSLMDDVT
jgi:hypothetical protein